MSLTIRRLLLATTSAIVGMFAGNVGVAKASPTAAPEPRSNFWSGSRRWRRMPKAYPYSGAREERRALLRLEFKLENGRWP